jgi:hypothetical protein
LKLSEMVSDSITPADEVSKLPSISKSSETVVQDSVAPEIKITERA